MEKVSLFNELKKGGYDSCIITTFNAYFPFYEEVLLRRLRSCGVQQNVVLIDSGMCQAAMKDAYPLVAGKHYTLAPMDCKAAFHPKIVLLLGKRKGLLAVGSHNLTFSGYGFNAEISNVIRYAKHSDKDTVHLFWHAWTAIQTWLDDYGLNLSKPARQSIDASIDGIEWLKPSAKGKDAATQFIFTSTSTPPLWDQVKSYLPTNPSACFVVGAFFDNKLSFLDRIVEDIVPDDLIVGVQPSTVHAPDHLLTRKDVNVVDNTGMMENNSDTEGTEVSHHQYFHAKAIYVDDKQNPVFLSGSANPSAPAWIASDSRKNAEALVLRFDENIENTVEDLGFKSLAKAPIVKAIITDRTDSNSKILTSTIRLVQASYQRGRLSFSWDALDGQQLVLLTYHRIEINRLQLTNYASSQEIDIQATNAAELTMAEIHCENKVIAKILIHFVDQIEAITAKGSKKKFQDALGTLETDSPELKQLFNCLDKIIFAKKERLGQSTIINPTSGDNSDIANSDSSLVVDWDGVNRAVKTKSKRLKASDDLTSILNAFVYGVSFGGAENVAFSGEDKYGRNEEEQIGKDDGEDQVDQEMSVSNGLTDREKLTLCNKRIKQIVNKVCTGLDLLKKGEQSHIDLLHTLLAVISLLKELNQRSRSFDWVTEEYMILPIESVKKLFSKVCECWWGPGYGLLHNKDSDNAVLKEVDELVRLRGLLVWLAWYADLSYNAKKPFNERTKDRDHRLWSNAVYVLLAQMVAEDEMVKEEAMRVSAAESVGCLNWFNELASFGRSLNGMYFDARQNLTKLGKPELEGWVLHLDEAFKGMRYGSICEENKVRFACVSKTGVFRKFISNKLATIVRGSENKHF